MGRIDDPGFFKEEENWAAYASSMEEQGLDPITGNKQGKDYQPLFSGPGFADLEDLSDDADPFGFDTSLEPSWDD